MKKMFLIFILFTSVLEFFHADESDIKIFEAVERSVVYVEVSFFLDKKDFTNHDLIKKIEKKYHSSILDSYLPVQTGSGFFITENGYLLSNEHVVYIKDFNIAKIEAYNGIIYNFLSKIPAEVLNAEEYKLVKNDIKKALDNSMLYYRVLVDNKNYYVCDAINSDKELDVAILKVKDGRNFSPLLLLGDSDILKVGEKCMAIGYPFATYFFELFKDLKSTMTLGSISAIRSDNWGIQHTASINPGNSGGPLLNKNGEVSGINVGVINNSNGLYFSIPINKVKVWLYNNNLSNIIYSNKVDSKKMKLYKNINIEYVETSKNIFIDLPEGYKVFVNGQYKGDTPLNLKGLPEGIITVRVESESEYSEQKLNVTKKIDIVYKYLPILNKYFGKLTVNTKPSGVKVFIDDVEIGVTPYTLNNIIIGKHTLNLTIDGYLPLSKEITISKNETKVLREELTKAFKVTFKDILPDDINIKIRGNGNEYNFTYDEKILLPPGKYEMELSSGKIYKQNLSFDLSRGENIEIDTKIIYIKSKLIFKKLKDDSKVIIDDIDLTEEIKDKSLELVPGTHTLIIKTTGFQDIKKTIIIEKDKNCIIYASYINSKLNYEHFYNAQKALLGVGIPLLSIGGIFLIVGTTGYSIEESLYPKGSFYSDHPSVVMEKNVFFALMATGIGLTPIGFAMAMISIPLYFIAVKVEKNSYSVILDYDKSNFIVGLKIKM